jgi:membrane protein required for beta-lactamase induction
VKYALILLSALLVVGCGGLTKEQQATAYNDAALKYDAVAEEAFATYETAFDAATTDSEDLIVLQDLFSAYAGADRKLADNLEAIEWTSEYVGTLRRMINCINEVYLLEIEVVAATSFQEANDLADVALEKSSSCDAIGDEIRNLLGLDPVED